MPSVKKWHEKSWYNKHNTKVEKRDRFSYYVFIEPVCSKPIGGLHLWYNNASSLAFASLGAVAPMRFCADAN